MLAPTIDEMEQSKLAHYRLTGKHLNITPMKNRLVVIVTEKPIRPVMLPRAKRSPKDRVMDAVKGKRIRVTVKK